MFHEARKFGYYHKLLCISCLFNLKKISTKLWIDLHSQAKIQIFTTEWSTTGQGLDFSLAVQVNL